MGEASAKQHVRHVGLDANGKLFTDMPNNVAGGTESWTKCYKDQECTTLRNQGLGVVREYSPKRHSCIATECAHHGMTWTGQTVDCGVRACSVSLSLGCGRGTS